MVIIITIITEARPQGLAWLALDSGRALALGSLHAKMLSERPRQCTISGQELEFPLFLQIGIRRPSLPPSRIIGRVASSSHCTTPRAHRRGMRAFAGFHHFLSHRGVSTCDLLGIRPYHHQEQHRQPLTKSPCTKSSKRQRSQGWA